MEEFVLNVALALMPIGIGCLIALVVIVYRTKERRKAKPKYEFYLFSGNRGMADRESERRQKHGWELAGSITPYTGNHGYEGMLIPFKRKV
jgi:hypothetical protein